MIRHTTCDIRTTKLLILFLFCLILPQAALAASPIAKDIFAKVIKNTRNSTLNILRLQASDADADTLSYTLLSLPSHGQLKEEAIAEPIATAPYLLNSNKLKYIPAPGFTGQDSFTYKANDASSDSNTAVVSLSIVEWFPPIGIPEPEFGIKETYRMYDEVENQAPGLTYRDSPSGGKYTHYIDSTDPNATDTSNLFGTVATPRKTIYWSTVSPYSYPAGSVIEVHHGPYDNGGVKGRTWDLQGTAQHPIFLRGVDQANMPKITMGTRLKGQYVILENLEFDGVGLIGVSTPMINMHANEVHDHIAIRSCIIHNNPGNMAITLGPGSRNVLVYGNRLYDNFNADGWDSSDEHDYNGVCIYAGEIGQTTEVSNIWITDNYAYHNQGDGVQFYWDSSYPTTRANYVYIGRNIFWQNRENGVDIKHGDNIIVSQNFISGYYIRNSCYGEAIGFGAEGPASNNWVIYNEITDSVRGAGGYHSKTEAYIIGNVFHDMVSAPYSGGITGGSVGTIINNTFFNMERGVNDQEVFLSDAIIINNIFSNCSVYNIYSRNTCYNNLLYQNGDPVVFNGGGTNVNGITTDPLFVNAANGNFNLNSGSPAIDAGTSSGVVQEVFDKFYQLYGIDIRKDIAGNLRPQGSAWDIGAYEYVPQGTVLYGDVSGDGEVSAYDAALAAQAAVGLISLTAEQTKAADVSGDGDVSAYDAALIAQKAVGLIDKFPVEG